MSENGRSDISGERIRFDWCQNVSGLHEVDIGGGLSMTLVHFRRD
jgi:hypothetical protein